MFNISILHILPLLFEDFSSCAKQKKRNCVLSTICILYFVGSVPAYSILAENTRGLDTGLRGHDDIHFLLTMFAVLCFQVSVFGGKFSFEDVVLC